MAKPNLTAQNRLSVERLQELLHYDPETGVFTWLVRSADRIHIGDIAGSKESEHIRITVDKYRFWAHRLAWLYMTGEWPTNQIDHVNGDGFDNRIENLRDVPGYINSQNMRRPMKNNKSSGLLGVHAVGYKWLAAITVNNVFTSLGYFSTPESAYAVYIEAKRRLHPGCTI